MVKKIIDVPENADYITVDEQINAGGSFLLKKYNVADLPDVPEKRVIELPDDMIAELKTIKEVNGDDNLQGFMNDVNDDEELYQGIEGFSSSGMFTDVLLGEWWLEHVEFVPKKEPKFYVDNVKGKHLMVDEQYGDVYHYPQVGVLNDYQYTEAEADKLVAGLTALNARKVKVEE